MDIALQYDFVSVPRFGYGKPGNPYMREILESRRDVYAQHLARFHTFVPALQDIRLEANEPLRPHWLNGYFPGLDALALHNFITLCRPALMIEVGSGNSTKFAVNAIRKSNLSTKLISIDPSPRAEINELCSEVLRIRLEEVDLSILDRLQANDIFFFDGSHYSFMGSDVTVLFLEIIPRLKPGVLIHIHDIFLPNDYPPTWIDRYYSEQYLLATLLLGGAKDLSIELPNGFISDDTPLNSLLKSTYSGLPEGVEPYGCSFWMRKL